MPDADDRAGWHTAPCPRCAGNEHHIVAEAGDHLYGVPGTFRVVACDDCGLWFQNPQPDDETLPSLYPDDYDPHRDVQDAADALPSAGTRRVLARRLGYAHLPPGGAGGWRSSRLLDPVRRRALAARLVPQFVEGGRLLELGCAAGQALERFRALGWKDLHGIELVPAAAQQARDKGFDVRCGRLEDALRDEPSNHYDVVYSTMVLEHLRDPFAILAEVPRVLKPGGRFLFSTVCRDAADRRWFGPYWAGFDLPRHMVFPSRRDLREALEPHFRDIRFVFQPAPVDLVRSASWRRRGMDRLVARIGTKGLLPLSAAFATLGRATRVSVQCTRR